MRVFFGLLATIGLCTLGAAVQAAADFTPAVIFDMGGKFDKSFNEAAYHGAEKFKDETGIGYLEFEITNESQRDQALRRMAQRADIVIAVGFAFSTPLETVAAEFPDKKFVIIDSVVDKPNVAVGGVQGARGQLPGRHGGGPGHARPARSASSAAWTSR